VNWQNISKAAMRHASVIAITAAVMVISQDRRDTQSNTMRPASWFHPASLCRQERWERQLDRDASSGKLDFFVGVSAWRTGERKAEVLGERYTNLRIGPQMRTDNHR
jgi:hypothetical protein